jgi:hypothetical protein
MLSILRIMETSKAATFWVKINAIIPNSLFFEQTVERILTKPG